MDGAETYLKLSDFDWVLGFRPSKYLLFGVLVLVNVVLAALYTWQTWQGNDWFSIVFSAAYFGISLILPYIPLVHFHVPTTAAAVYMIVSLLFGMYILKDLFVANGT